MVLPNAALSSDATTGTTAVTVSGSDDTIKEPHEHDVLCGRGGSINSWKGNERFRTLVEKRKRVYLTARFKREKRLIASSIVQEIQSLDPPGRFLSRNAKKGTWFVIDDDKARDKVSQALRENAPTIRAEIETEINEQRAEIQRSQHEPHHPPPPNAGNVPPNHYYPQGWGYFSYYGYAQQSSHPHPPPPPGGPMPPPPPHYHPGYAASANGQWNAGRGSPPQPHHHQQPQHPPHRSPPSPPPSSSEPTQQQQHHQQQQHQQQQHQHQQQQQHQQQHPQQQQHQRQRHPQQQQHQPQQQQQQQPTFNFSFSPKPTTTSSKQVQQKQERPRPQQPQPPRAPAAPLLQAVYKVAPAPQYKVAPAPQQPQVQAVYKVAPASADELQDDDKSLFDTTAELMNSVLPSSIASWTKDALSLAGMSIGSNRDGDDDDDPQDNSSVISKPIQYVHYPEETQSVSSKARSVRFKDERSISGRSLEPRKNTKPPRIMHSSQINYPRRPRRNSNGNSQPPRDGRPPTMNFNNPMAPVSSVNLSDHNDGMISLITTEGMNSIVEEGPIMMEEYEQHMQKMTVTTHHQRPQLQHHHHQSPNEEFKQACDDPALDTEPLSLERRSSLERKSLKRRTSRRDSLDSMGSMGDNSNSMLTAVANQIVMGLGSWDASTVACGPEGGPGSIGVPKEVNKFADTMAVETEGQEVQLVDMDTQQDMAGDNSVIEDRMPPHSRERIPVDWPSRVGSCHSFFNDSLAGASFFSGGNLSKGDAISPACSMDMDVSSGTDPFSCADSVGGASLCRVFDAEAITKDGQQQPMQPPMPSPSLHNRMLSQMPSWERNLRVNGSQDGHDDHGSFMTKSSEKLMGGSISTIGSIEARETNEKQQQQQQQQPTSGVMAWESHNKE